MVIDVLSEQNFDEIKQGLASDLAKNLGVWLINKGIDDNFVVEIRIDGQSMAKVNKKDSVTLQKEQKKQLMKVNRMLAGKRAGKRAKRK